VTGALRTVTVTGRPGTVTIVGTVTATHGVTGPTGTVGTPGDPIGPGGPVGTAAHGEPNVFHQGPAHHVGLAVQGVNRPAGGGGGW
jgi:hypothetical protein